MTKCFEKTVKVKTLILGLGNPILTDDGVGLRVAQALAERIVETGVTIEESSLSGLSLLDELVGFDRVIIIDAIQTVNGRPGDIYVLNLEDFSITQRATSTHGVDLLTAIELGRQLNLKMPHQISIFAIEAKDVTTFAEACSPEVERAIPECVDMVIADLGRDSHVMRKGK